MDRDLSSQPHESDSPQNMSALTSIEDVYASPPHQATPDSASPDMTTAEQQLIAGMSALQSHDGDSHRAYLPSQWNACLGARTGSEDYENYSLHSSPAVSSLQQDTASPHSSPRSWATSPEQYGSMAWEPVPDYPRLDPQLSGYPLNNTSIPTSFPAEPVPFVPSQSLHGFESKYQPSRSQTNPYPVRYHGSPRDVAPLTPESGYPLSPCSTTLGLRLDENMASPPGDVDNADSTLALKGTGVEGHGNASTPADPNKEEPYAQLIYRAFLSTPRRALTLQEIYQWFRENTEKGKDESKGWQNSIRHNLSMNLAFTKRDRKLSTSKDGEGEISSSSSDAKKSTEWFLEPWAAAGVQSTTRYRKGNNSRRSAAGRAYRSYAHHGRVDDFGSGRCGRKGGGVLSGRIRGRPASLRNAAAATAASQMQHHHYHPFSPSPHHINHQPLLHHHRVNDPSSYAFYHSSPTSHAHGHVMDPMTTIPTTTNSEPGTLSEYDYPDPQLFPHHPHHHHQHALFRASSESAIDEPLTTEPAHGDDGMMLPDFQRHHHHHHHGMDGSVYPLQQQQQQGVVGMYNEVDRYHHGHGHGHDGQGHQGQGWGGVVVEETGFGQGY